MFLAAALVSAIVSSPAHIAVVDGAATIARDGRLMPATADAPFVSGDRLRTTAGRVEVTFPDGTTLDVDEQSAVDLESPTVLRLITGRVHLIVARAEGPEPGGRYRIDPDRGTLTLEAGEETFARAGEAPVIAVEEQPPLVQVYGGSQVINERCSLVAAPSLAEIARRQPHRRASTRTIVMTAPAERPPAVPTRPLTPPSAPVVVPHATDGVVVARAPTVARPQPVQPEPVPTPSYVAAPPRAKMAPTHAAPVSRTSDPHPHRRACNRRATGGRCGSKMTSTYAHVSLDSPARRHRGAVHVAAALGI